MWPEGIVYACVYIASEACSCRNCSSSSSSTVTVFAGTKENIELVLVFNKERGLTRSYL